MVKTTSTGYDHDGNVTSQTDGNGDETTYAYNALNQRTSSTNALSKETTYTYDADGNVATETTPNGVTVTESYDHADELTGVSYSDSTHSVSYSYDADGRKTGMTDGTGTSSWTYDSLGRLTSYTNGAGSEVQYGYDIANNQTSITYPGSDTVTQGFNNGNQMTSITDWNSNESTFSYDANGNLTGESLPNGVTDSYTFDHADNLTGISDVNGSTTIFSATYGMNSNNLITSDSSQNSSTGSYQYTPLNQVCYAGSSNTNACGSAPSGADVYAYDSAGNLTNDNGTTQSFNAGDQLCWSYAGSSSNGCSSAPTGATAYTYDSDGNRTASTPSSGSASAYTYNGADELTQYQLGSGTSTSYAYDGDGLRQSKTTGSTTTDYLWDVSGSLPLLLQEATGSSTTSYIYGPNGLPLEEILPSGSTYYYAHDSLGSTRALTDSSGTVQNTDIYDPYGNLTASTGSVANNLLYAGQYLDSESGLYYMRARYYDPATAEFTSVDPLVQHTQQPYDYAAGDPVNESDMSGMAPSWWPGWLPDCTIFDGNCGGIDQPALQSHGLCNVGQAGCTPDIPTLSVCAGGGWVTGLGAGGNVCVVESEWKQFGTSETGYGGMGIDVQAGLSIYGSNATSIHQLQGPAMEGSAGFWFGGGGSFNGFSIPPFGCHPVVASGGAGLKGLEVGAQIGVSYTSTQTIWQT